MSSGVPQFDFVQPTEHKSKVPRVLLIARVTTFISVVVSLILLKVNDFHDQYGNGFGYKDITSYKYAFFVMVVVFAYTLIQLPFAIYYLFFGKRSIKGDLFLQCDYYADTVITFLLATGLGASFGVTVDSKGYVDESKIGGEYQSDFDRFFDIAYTSAGFLLLGFLASALSSIISSRALWAERITHKK